MIPNNFVDYYKTISNAELMDILEHQNDYQPLAIDAARKELENRQLSEEQIREARKPLIEERLEKEEQKKKIIAFGNKARNAGNTIADTLHPLRRETPTTDKFIKLISIAFFARFLFKIISDFKIISRMLNNVSKFDSSSFFYFLPFIVLPVASIAFWMKKTYGWMLTAFYIIYCAIGAIAILIESFTWKSTGTAFDNLFPRPSPVVFIILTGFLIAVLFFISKPAIREVFKINRDRLIATIFMSSLVTIFLMVEA